MSHELFFKAAQKGWRFASESGPLTAEHLFQLPLVSQNRLSLDAVAKDLHRELQEKTVSFVEGVGVNEELQDKLELVKAVIAHKQTQAALAAQAAQAATLRNKALEILASRQNASLEALSDEDLKKLAAGQ